MPQKKLDFRAELPENRRRAGVSHGLSPGRAPPREGFTCLGCAWWGWRVLAERAKAGHRSRREHEASEKAGVFAILTCRPWRCTCESSHKSAANCWAASCSAAERSKIAVTGTVFILLWALTAVLQPHVARELGPCCRASHDMELSCDR